MKPEVVDSLPAFGAGFIYFMYWAFSYISVCTKSSIDFHGFKMSDVVKIGL